MKDLRMQKLLNEIETIETLITIYSDRDQVRTVELETKLHDLNMQCLELMSENNSVVSH